MRKLRLKSKEWLTEVREAPNHPGTHRTPLHSKAMMSTVPGSETPG